MYKLSSILNKAIVVSALVVLLIFSSSTMLDGAQNTSYSLKKTIQVVKPAFGSSNIVFGQRIGITNSTYLGSLSYNGKEVAYYYLNSGMHYVSSVIPSEKPLNWSKIKDYSSIKLENLNIPVDNNYKLENFGTGTQVFSSDDEIEGMEIYGDYVYITYRRMGANVEMRYLSNFTLIKSVSIGNSTYNHCGGILRDNYGHLWTILAQPINKGPSYIYEFDKNLNEIQHFITDDDHYGTVFFVNNGIIVVGNWNSQQIAEFNTTTHELIKKVNTPPPFKSTQDTAYLGSNYYIGARVRTDYNYSGIYLYHWNGDSLSFDTNLLAYHLNGTNPIGVDKYGYIYADSSENKIFKTKDVFLPLVYSNISGGDRYNIGFSDTWPCVDSGSEEYIMGGTGSDVAIGFEMYNGNINRTNVITGKTTGIFKWSYYGTYADINGNLVKGGLPTSSKLTTFGAQTWGSANENLRGNVYLSTATPYLVVEEKTPSSPTNFTATTGNKFVNLTWDPPSDYGSSAVTSYKIYRNDSLIATVPATQLWYNDTNVRNGVTYSYYITAVNSVGEGDKSNKILATPSGAVPEFSGMEMIAVILFIAMLVLLKRKI